MAASLDDLYREIILEHYRSPKRKGHLEQHTHAADGANPLCGDQLTVEIVVADGKIEDVAFSGQGCSISQASASMMSDFVAGRSVRQALEGVGVFQRMMTEGEPPEDEAFADIEALIGVAKFPVRVKCASLGWKTLEQAIEHGASGAAAPVSTDERTASE
jgi:nitrogen fixation NifU-like protein